MRRKTTMFAFLIIGGFGLISMTISDTETQDPWVAPKEYQKMENPFIDYEDEEKIGRLLFSKLCKSCHGSKGKGDGKNAALMGIKMVDFTDGTIKNQSDGSIYYKINKGRGFMPTFNKKISDDKEKWLVINYIRRSIIE